MPIVLDSSMAMALSMDDEDVPDAEQVLARVVRERTLVPALWHYEIANALVVAVRRGRVEAEQVQSRLALLLDLPIEIDDRAPNDCSLSILELARKHDLTAYDAAYVELAVRRSFSLATLDNRMAKAGRAEGIDVIGS